jgi:hypothetical protein
LAIASVGPSRRSTGHWETTRFGTMQSNWLTSKTVSLVFTRCPPDYESWPPAGLHTLSIRAEIAGLETELQPATIPITLACTSAGTSPESGSGLDLAGACAPDGGGAAEPVGGDDPKDGSGSSDSGVTLPDAGVALPDGGAMPADSSKLQAHGGGCSAGRRKPGGAPAGLLVLLAWLVRRFSSLRASVS